jgi:hypothetical protein
MVLKADKNLIAINNPIINDHLSNLSVFGADWSPW